MSEINTNNQTYNLGTGTPLYNSANSKSYKTPAGQTVNITMPSSGTDGITNPIYQYPVSSLYAPYSSSANQTQGAQEASSGVNIHIYNPSAIGGQNSSSAASAAYGYPEMYAATASKPLADTPISDTTKSEQKTEKTKEVVELTDSYIKTLESYLRSDDKSVRKMGIQDLIKRFEEDETRYGDEALTALLNIALQDTDADNRLLAISPVAAGSAHGDETTIELLQNLTNSDKLYGQEAVMASDALLKCSHSKTAIPDNSPQKTEQIEEEEEEEEEEQ